MIGRSEFIETTKKFQQVGMRDAYLFKIMVETFTICS